MNVAALLDRREVQLLLRLALGGVFLYAAGSKIYSPGQFAVAVSNYRLLPHEWTHLAAITVPWVEAIAGTLVILGVWLRPSALVLLGLTGVFMAAIASALARGLNIECGCFGTVGGRQVGLASLAFDAVLLAMAAALVWRVKAPCPSPPPSTPGPSAECTPPSAPAASQSAE